MNVLTPDDIKFVINLLRRGSVKWSGRAEALRLSREKVFVRYSQKGQAVYKYHWKCNACKELFRDVKNVEVDHVIEIGSFCGDWNNFLKRIFPRPVSKHLQVLCARCHLKKTMAFNSAVSRWKRKRGVSHNHGPTTT